MKINIGVSNLECIKKSKSFKLIKKAIGTTAICTLAFSVLITSGCKDNTYTINNNPKSVCAQIVTSENSEQEFFQQLLLDAERFKEVLDYISISEELDKLELDMDDIDLLETDKLLSLSQLENLIKQYKSTKDKNQYNKVLAVQQKLCNQKIFEGYRIGNNYFLNLSKYIASLMYDADPLTIHFEFSTNNGEPVVKIIIDNETYTASKGNVFDCNKENGILESLLVDLVSDAVNMQNQDASIKEQQSYNKDRNKLIVSSNKSAAMIFNEAIADYSSESINIKK